MLVIDGCMLGVLGKVLVVIYVLLEVLLVGLIGKVKMGDVFVIDVEVGVFDIEVDDVEWYVCLVV